MKTTLRLLLKILPVFVIVLVIIEIVVTNELVQSGKNVQVINSKIDALQEENERIAQKIASGSSLIAIEQKAKTMGFIPASQSIVLGQEEFALQSR